MTTNGKEIQRRILGLRSENIKRIKVIDVHPNGKSVVLGGPNRSGKTSLLDCIQYAITGGKHIPDQVVRRGAEHGLISIDLGDIIVERIFEADSSSRLVVKSKEGAIFESPQAMLNKMFNDLSFDPLGFMAMEPKKQVEQLKSLVDYDFAGLEARRKATFDARTETNRKLKQLEGELSGLGAAHADAPPTEASVAELVAELERREAVNRSHATRREALVKSEASQKEACGEIRTKQGQIAILKVQLQLLESDVGALQKAVNARQDAIDCERVVLAGKRDEDTRDIKDRLSKVDQDNAKVRHNANRRLKEEALARVRGESEAATSRLQSMDLEVQQAIAAAKLPVVGLGMSEAGITLNGLPLDTDHTSQAEMIRVSAAIGLAKRPSLRVMLIRQGALLDDDGFAELAKIAEEEQIQFWVELVGDRGPVTVLIEDGLVKELRDPAAVTVPA